MLNASPLGKVDWGLMMEFARRFEPDFDKMNAEGAQIPHQLRECTKEITNLACDISCNGTAPSEWKNCTNPESIEAQRAALRLIMCAATEIGFFLETLEQEAKNTEKEPDKGE